jgi:hypothetical protein
MIATAILISLAAPIDRGMAYFKYITAVYSFFTVSSLLGVAALLYNSGFVVEEKFCSKADDNPYT